MVKIELTSEQLSELRQHYIVELEKIQQRSTEIISLLKAIVAGSAASDADVRKPSEKREVPVRHEMQSHAPGWSEYIPKLLNERKRAVTKDQIFKAYQQEYKVDFPDPNAAKNRLSMALHYLQSKKHLIEGAPRKGKRGNLYSMVEETPIEKKNVIQQEPKKIKPGEENVPEVKGKESAHTARLDVPEKRFIQFIIDTLKKEKRIFNRDELVKYAMINLGIPSQNKKSTSTKITDTINYMVKESGSLMKTKKKGKKGMYYGLVDWFDDENTLIVDYR